VPVRLATAPLPEIVRARGEAVAVLGAGERLVEAVLRAERWAVQQSDVQEQQLDNDHDRGLDKEGKVVARAEPVEDSVGEERLAGVQL